MQRDAGDSPGFTENQTSVMKSVVAAERIENRILLLRGCKVILDNDLADLYEVEVKQLKRQVRRNIDRFPADFMFELSPQEYESLRRHFGTLKRGEHSKYLPYAFTEQGVAMLSSVLKSKRAAQVNRAASSDDCIPQGSGAEA